MRLIFTKYSGCGNDFILFDDREQEIPTHSAREWVPQLCHRRLGIGADGVILWQRGDSAPHRMRIFNADGGEAEMCGNGIRCLAHYIRSQLATSSSFEIDTMDGVVHIRCERDDEICTGFPDPYGIQWDLSLADVAIQQPIDLLNTGVPHLVVQVEHVDAVDLTSWARPLRHHPDLTQGANVNIYHLEGLTLVRYRTFERGVEDETLACGTGAAAVALSAARRHGLQSPLAVKTSSGDVLRCDFQLDGTGASNLSITGPAVPIFEGSIELGGYSLQK